MARTVYRAKRSGCVPQKMQREMWHSADIPQDIRRPWEVFHEDAVFTDVHEDLRAVQKLGALRAFQALPACRQREYTAVSLQELSAFAAWSATSGLADAMERVAAWTGLDDDLKAEHVPHNWRALLAEDPTWRVLIADDVKEEVEVPIRAAPALGGAPARVSSPSAQTPPKPPLPTALVAADGSYPAYGLKIKQPWMGHILRGEKIWEIRGKEARVIGRVALFEAGAMHFVGLATIVESILVTDADMAANVDKHCIEDWDTNPMLAKYRERKNIFAYVLSDVVSIEPVAANLGSSVIWSILANWLTMPSAPNAAGATRVGGVGKTSTAKARGVGRKSTQRAAGDKQNLHKPVCKRPARESNDPAATAQPALGEASGESPAAAVAGPFGSCRLTRRNEGEVERQSWLMVCDHPDHQTDGRCAKEYRVAAAGSEDVALRRLKTWILWGRRESVMTRADHKKLWKDILELDDDNGLPTMSALDAAVSADGAVSANGKRGRKPRVFHLRVDALEAKYPWGREGGPPPASEEERQSLAAEMVRLRKEAKNFSRPERANATTPALKARAEAMLLIMRGKAHAGFGGGQATALQGLSLNRSVGSLLATRAHKLVRHLDTFFDTEAAHYVQIEESITLLNAD